MDDSRTKQMLDSLADLFLTNPPVAPAPPQPSPTVESKSDDAGSAASSTPNTTSHYINNQLEGPAPIRLHPKVNAAASHQETSHGPSLRLHREGQDAPSDGRRRGFTAPAAAIEAVFLGSLPGFAGPWRTQYAQQLARAHGCVAMIMLDEQQIDVEIVLPDASDPAFVPGIEPSLPATLQRLRNVGLWIVDMPVPPHDGDATHLKTLPRWTILSGADEMACHAAANLIKAALRIAGFTETSSQSSGWPDIGIAIMGADQDDAAAAIERIRDASDDMLRSRITLRTHIQKMAPVHTQMVGSFANVPDEWNETLSVMKGNIMEATASQAIEQETQGATSTAAPQPQRVDRPDEPLEYLPPRGSRTYKGPIDGDATVASSTDDDAPATAQQSRPRVDRIASSNDRSPSLSQYIEGGVLLEARCPKHDQTDFVLDSSGRIHLLRKHIGDPAKLHHAVLDLIETRTWLGDHFDLVKLTARQFRFDTAAEPLLHLFTNEAKVAVDLIPRIGPFVKLHLLQPVQIGEETAWCCNELN